jgi:hypothetical protein
VNELILRPFALQRQLPIRVFADEQNALTHCMHDAFDLGVLLLELEADLVAGDEHDPDSADISKTASGTLVLC